VREQVQTYLWSFAIEDKLGVYNFILLALVSFRWGFFFVVVSLPMFCFYSRFYSIAGTDPETIARSPHFAFTVFPDPSLGLVLYEIRIEVLNMLL